MKRLLNFMLLACVMMFASCSSDIEEFETGTSGDKITIGVGMPGTDTRVSTANLLNLTWENGDKIFLMGYDDNNKYLGKTNGYIQSGAGTANAKFSVSTVSGATKYKVYYNNAVNRGPISFDNNGNVNANYMEQIRYKTNESETIKETIILGSDFIPAANIEKGAYLKIRNSVLRLNIKNMHSSQKDGKIADVTWKVNGKEVIYSPMADVKITEGQNNYFYFSFNPETDLVKNGTVSIDINANYSKQSASARSANGKNYEPGKIYTITIANDKDGKWGIIGAAGGSEGGGDTKPIDPNAKAWAGKTFWVEGIQTTNLPDESKWFSGGTAKSGYEIFQWQSNQGWYHCMKKDPVGEGIDSHLCWAATSSNMIYWWLDRNKANIEKYNKMPNSNHYNGPSKYTDCLDCEVFQYFKDHFANKAMQVYYGMTWFFTGQHVYDPDSKNSSIEGAVNGWPEHKGFFTDVLGNSNIYRVGGPRTFNDDVKWAITNKGIIGLGAQFDSTGAHAVTIYGAKFDENGNVYEIYMADNNDNEYSTPNDPKKANPRMKKYRVTTDSNGVTWLCNWNLTKNLIIYTTVTITSNQNEWDAFFKKHNM